MEWMKLTDICSPKQWKTISTQDLKETGYPVYGANGIIGYYNEYTHDKPTVMITCRGATCGSINISCNKAYINGNAMALDDVNEEIINLRYLYFFLLQYDFKKIISGTAQPQITRTNLKSLKVLIPSMDIQEKIVQLLDEAQYLIDSRKEQIELLDKLTESLFYEMFGNPVKNEKGWVKKKLGEVVKFKSAEIIKEEYKPDSDVWVLNLDAIESNNGKILEKRYIKYSEIPASVIYFDNRHILYSKLRPYLNKVVLPDEKGFATSELVPLIPNVDISKAWLSYALRTKPIVKYLNTHTSGAKMPRVVMVDFKNMNIPVPPLSLQNEFATRVEAIEKQKQLLQESLRLMEDNYNAIMQRAFKGELF